MMLKVLDAASEFGVPPRFVGYEKIRGSKRLFLYRKKWFDFPGRTCIGAIWEDETGNAFSGRFVGAKPTAIAINDFRPIVTNEVSSLQNEIDALGIRTLSGRLPAQTTSHELEQIKIRIGLFSTSITLTGGKTSIEAVNRLLEAFWGPLVDLKSVAIF